MHTLFLKRKRQIKRHKKETIAGTVTLLLISVGMGIVFRYIGIAWYEFYDVIPKKGVITGLGIVGAFLGFSGTLYFVDLFKSSVVDARKAIIKRYERNERDPYENEYPPRLDDEEK